MSNKFSLQPNSNKKPASSTYSGKASQFSFTGGSKSSSSTGQRSSAAHVQTPGEAAPIDHHRGRTFSTGATDDGSSDTYLNSGSSSSGSLFKVPQQQQQQQQQQHITKKRQFNQDDHQQFLNHQQNSSSSLSGGGAHKALRIDGSDNSPARPVTSAGSLPSAPPRLSFPASDSGGSVNGGAGPNSEENPLAQIFQSSYQLQSQALSTLLSRSSEMERLLKQKMALTRDLDSAKREIDKQKSSASELKSSLSLQRKWNVIVDIRLKSLIAARDSIIFLLQMLTSKGSSQQKAIDDLYVLAEGVSRERDQLQKSCKQLTLDKKSLETQLAAAISDFQFQGQLAQGLGAKIIELQEKQDGRFDSLDSGLKTSTNEILNRYLESEKRVSELEANLQTAISTSEEALRKAATDADEARLIAANELKSLIVLSNQEKERISQEMKESYSSHFTEKDSRISYLETENAKLQSSITAKEKNLLELEKAKEDLQASISHLGEKEKELKSGWNGTEKDFINACRDLELSKANIISVEEKLQVALVENCELKKRISDLSGKLQEMEAVLASTQTSLSEFKVQVAAFQADLDQRSASTSKVAEFYEKVVAIVESKDEGVAEYLKTQLMDKEQKLEVQVEEQKRLKQDLSERLAAFKAEKEQLEIQNTARISEKEQKIVELNGLLAGFHKDAESKAQTDAKALTDLRKALEQDLENHKYEAGRDLKALKDENAQLQVQLDELRASKSMARSLSDIAAEKTGPRASQVSAMNVKKEVAKEAARGTKARRGGKAAQGPQRKIINEQIDKKNSFDLFEAPF